MVVKPSYILYDSQKKMTIDGVNFLRDDNLRYLLQEGPTGMGKTVVLLMLAMHWNSKEKRNVIYFSREHEQIRQCISDLRELIRVNDHDVHAVHIAGRSFSCLRPEVIELEDEDEKLIACEELHTVICNYSQIVSSMERSKPPSGHIYTLLPQYRDMYYQFDVQTGDTAIGNLNSRTHLEITSLDDIVDELFTDGIATNEVVMEVATKYLICPRKLQNLAMKHANIIFAPYNYMVIPRIVIKEEHEYLYIIDEAHNLDQNLTSMQSFQISKTTMQSFIEAIYSRYAGEDAFIQATETVMYQLGNIFEHDTELMGDALRDVLKQIDNESFDIMEAHINMYVRRGIRRRVITQQQVDSMERIPRSFITMQKFMQSMRRVMENKNSAIIKVEDTNIYIRFVDTDVIFTLATQPAKKVIVASGTLYPKFMQMYLGMLEIMTKCAKYDPPHTRLGGTGQIVSKVDGVALNTRYADRSIQKFVSIAKVISEIYNNNPAGTLVFLPSYSYLSGVAEMLSSTYNITVYKHKDVDQYREKIADGERALFMTAFRGHGSEGWNFPDNQSRAIILCGTPYLPIKDIMVNAQMEYYTNKHGKKLGSVWYKQKAVLWLIQAFGRGIRHKDDWCRVYFLDDRIHQMKRFFPQWVKSAINWRPKVWTGSYGR